MIILIAIKINILKILNIILFGELSTNILVDDGLYVRRSTRIPEGMPSAKARCLPNFIN
jgi:hypothetical protein